MKLAFMTTAGTYCIFLCHFLYVDFVQSCIFLQYSIYYLSSVRQSDRRVEGKLAREY